MKVQLLGELGASDDQGEYLDVRGVKQRTLLALLALHRGQAVSADRLVDAIWGDDLPGNPGNALQAQVAQLRRVLGAESIVTRQGGYALVADVDLDEFESLVERGTKLIAAGDVLGASGALERALSLCRGEPLADFAFAEFATGERVRLEELRLSAIESKFEADLALGRSDLAGDLEALCRDYPLRERLWALRMTALYRSGRQAEALRAYGEAREILVEELGVDPGPELQRLEAMVLSHDPALEGIPQATGQDGEEPPGNLPVALTRFVGRLDEVAQLKNLVGLGRLVSLVGPGGAGKSRLAVEAAGAMAEQFPHGAWLAELAAVNDGAGVAPAIASALGMGDMAERRRGTSATSSVDALISYLAGRSLLLVVDNCEHLIVDAAAVLETLLKAVPGLRVLATTREPLGVPGEQLLPVGPLPLSDALALFADRARAAAAPADIAGEDAGLAEDVCRQLDGMPLAIELAAARLRALPLAQLAARLDDRFRLLSGGSRTAVPRHQTLRAVVDWSYALLFADEQLLFRRISVFVGPFTLEDAEEVCADEGLPRADILELLSHLVDKSLVTIVPGGDPEARFVQLQTLATYGRDRLDDCGDAGEARTRHAAHFRKLAEGAHDGLRGATAPAWRERLVSALGNLRAALDFFIETEDGGAAMALTSGIAWLWFLNGEWAEGVRWLGDALRVPGLADPMVEATARAWHGYFACMSLKPPAGVADCEAAAGVLRGGGEPIALAEALLLCGSVLMRAHQFERALEYLGEARVLLEQAGHGWLLAVHDIISAFNLAPLGRLDEAEAAARASLQGFDAHGEVYFSVDPLNILAGIAEARGDLEQAAQMHEAVLERCRASGQRNYIPFKLVHLATLRARRGEDAAADALYQEAIASTHNRWLRAEAMIGQAASARRLGDLPRARALLDAAVSHYDEVGVSTGRARVLAGLVWWSLSSGDPAAAMVAARDAMNAEGANPEQAVQVVVESALAAAKAVAEPTRRNIEAFMAIARRRAEGGLAFGTLPDEPDVAALASRLSLPGR